jgi:hypothetical protein
MGNINSTAGLFIRQERIDEATGELETKSICQKFGEVCRKSSATRVLPSPDLIDRATRQGRSSFVFMFVRISSSERITFAESCINPPTELTFTVDVFSENGSSNSHPYTNTGVASATLKPRRLSFRSGARLSSRHRLDHRRIANTSSKVIRRPATNHIRPPSRHVPFLFRKYSPI